MVRRHLRLGPNERKQVDRMVTRIANDPKSKRADTYVLGPPVSSSAKRKGQK